jgi:organic radical activating enzyme
MQFKIEKKYKNLFQALKEQQYALAKISSYPVSLCLDAASACPLHCPFCIHGKPSSSRPFSILKWDLFEPLIDELGPYLFQVDLFNWGEPLVNQNLLKMIALLKSHEVSIRLSTSLALPLSKDFLERLILSGIDYLIVSIDGMSFKTYETYRVGGDFHLAMSNLEELAKLKRRLKADKPRLEWQYLVFSFNEHELPQASRHARKIGVEFRPVAPYIDLNQHPEWLSTQRRFVRESYRSIVIPAKSPSQSATGRGNQSSGSDEPTGTLDVENMQRIAEPGRMTEEGSPHPVLHLASAYQYPCDWLYVKACVNSDGSLSACCGRSPGDPDWGKLEKGAFYKVWNNANFEKARISLAGCAEENDSRIICAHCPLPEIQQDCGSVILDALLAAPDQYQESARMFLNRFSRGERLKRQAFRMAGKLSRRLPFYWRDRLKLGLRSVQPEEFFRKAKHLILKDR